MKAVVYRLRLLEPVLIAQAGAGEENSAVALPYIPGSALRGALAARWTAAHPGADLAADKDARPWFLDGTVCHLNAYPECEGERALPMPASWLTLKDLADSPSAAIYDLAVGPDPKQAPLKPPGGGPFCVLRREAPPEDRPWEEPTCRAILVRPLRFDQVHIALEDVNQRGKGNLVFRYEALAAGLLFAGAIVAPDETDLAPLKALLESGDLLLGSAHLAGYGRVAVESCAIETGWREVAANAAVAQRVVVTLLSDAIVRGEDGQVGGDGGLALAAALGCPAGAAPEAAYGRTRLVGGYNRKWSLPLPQDWALAAGSVFVFDPAVIDPVALQAAVERGVGERRAEGFGRIAVGWQAAYQVYRTEETPGGYDAPPLSPDSKKAARGLVQRRLRLVLDRALDQRVNANVDRLTGAWPENAQLSAIRQATAPGLAGGDLSGLIAHLENLKSTGRSQLERSRIGNQTLFAWLRERAEKLDVQQQLLEQSQLTLPVMAGETAALDGALRGEYTARLIDGMMRLAAKRKEAKR